MLRDVPKYAKYIKDIVANKTRLTEFETAALTEECTSRIQHKLPQKLKDLGSFTILVRISEIDVGRALCDLGESINLMSLLVFKQLGLGDLRPTTVMLQLADRSYVYHEGVIVDVLLQIGKFIFPIDFIILDYEADELVLIILERPLLTTGDVIIKVREGKMIMRVDNEEAVFNVYRAIQLPRHYEDLAIIYRVEINELAVEPSVFKEDALERALMLFNHLELEEEVEEILQILDGYCEYIRERSQFEPLDRPISPSPKSSVEEAPKQELKPLPSHFHYAYLGSSNTLPVIVSSHFSNLEEEKLLRVLREHKHAISWTMSDIKGFNPALKLNNATRKDHFPLPFIDQKIDRLAGQEYYCFLDDYSGYNQIGIDPKDQEKTTFTCPYGTYAFKRMPFRLCNAPATFQMCMMAIFIDMVEQFVEVFMDNISVFDPSFDECLTYLAKVLARYEETNLGINLEIRNPNVTENQVADHLSRLETRNHVAKGDVIKENFPNEQLFVVTAGEVPWYTNFINYLASGDMSSDLEPHAKKNLRCMRSYVWDESFLFKSCTDKLMRRCVPESGINAILHDCHTSPYDGHHAGHKMAAKVLQSSFYCPRLFKDAYEFVRRCDRYQTTGTITKQHEMPLHGIIEDEIFDVWGIDFMGQYPLSNGFKYIWWLLTMCRSDWNHFYSYQ
ncbi:uncharacterized protein LOC142180018 [Nicotiana tabacum]|uniref:Uncharacterized protein LOC142180018 n=1 Tax=Nicotiana tabacum TaxID=4097 RepID=A0AC58UC25_TOBAC